MINVYSQPNCVQCKATYRALERAQIEYTVVDLTEDEQAMAMVKSLGYVAAPVVIVDSENHWSGYRPDLIKKLASTTAQ